MALGTTLSNFSRELNHAITSLIFSQNTSYYLFLSCANYYTRAAKVSTHAPCMVNVYSLLHSPNIPDKISLWTTP